MSGLAMARQVRQRGRRLADGPFDFVTAERRGDRGGEVCFLEPGDDGADGMGGERRGAVDGEVDGETAAGTAETEEDGELVLVVVEAGATEAVEGALTTAVLAPAGTTGWATGIAVMVFSDPFSDLSIKSSFLSRFFSTGLAAVEGVDGADAVVAESWAADIAQDDL